MKKILFILSTLIYLNLFAQQKYPQAPEIWSKPDEIKAISNWGGYVDGISISSNGKKLYLSVGGIALSELSDTGWTAPLKLGPQININYDVHRPCISPNGKRLFYVWVDGGGNGYLHYSDWDSVKNDWGISVDCGIDINTPPWINGCTAPDDSTIIFLRSDTSYMTHWDKKTNTWVDITGFPTTYLEYFSARGIYVTPQLTKIYSCLPRNDTTLTGYPFAKEDLGVSYKRRDNPLAFTASTILNISYQADTLYFNGEYERRDLGFPTLTADGKTLFLVANFHNLNTVYESHMLIDEKGNPVTSVSKSNQSIPNNFKLLSPYPNPFNPGTTIEYSIAKETKVKIIVYDSIGRKVKELVNEIKTSGNYKTHFNASNLPSGIYLIALYTSSGFSVQKSIYLK